MYLAAGLAGAVLFPQHAAAISLSSGLLALLRKRRNGGGARAAVAGASGDVQLEWEGLQLIVGGGKVVLDGVSGSAKPGRVLALAGPSGSGKTSLLMALAGRVETGKGVGLSGIVRVNGERIESGGVECAFVPQDDVFFSMLTVRETLETAARLRLPRNMGDGERAEFVERIIAGLGLGGCAGTRVGNTKVRGISGGEKKRLSLACELISSPRVIFADEPLSGVDSFQAKKVMASLRKLAKEGGHTVVFSVHQPSGAILRMCDDLVLLAQGNIVYAGEVVAAEGFFEGAGLAVEEGLTNAEHYLKVVSVDTESEESVRESQARIDGLVKAFAKKRVKGGGGGGGEVGKEEVGDRVVAGKKGVGVFGQLRLLLQRAFRQVTRDKKTNVARLMSSVMSALLFGSIYWRMGYAQSTIQDRLGLLQVCCINAAMSALVKTLQVFGTEKEIVSRERAGGAYDVLPYFASKLIAELPVSAVFPLVFSAFVYPMCGLSGGVKRIAQFVGLITLESFTSASYGLFIGSLASTPEAAVAIGPASFVIFIVFGGLYVNGDNVPAWLSWVPRVSIIKHAFEGLCVNEFRGIEFESKRPWDVRTGEQQLARLGWAESTVAKTCISQARVLAINYLLTYAVLKMKAPRYQPLEEPAVVVENVTESSEVAAC